MKKLNELKVSEFKGLQGKKVVCNDPTSTLTRSKEYKVLGVDTAMYLGNSYTHRKAILVMNMNGNKMWVSADRFVVKG